MKAPRADVIALAAIATAAAIGIGLMIVRSSSAGADPLEAVPADAFLVASIDVASLAQSPLGEALVGHGGTRTEALLGVDSITEACGFDPLPHLRSIAIAIPEGEGEHGEFGVAASGTLAKAALASCVRAVIAKRGGEAEERQTGSFTVVADAHHPGGAEVAFREGGPYLVGRGAWLARMIDAADGRIPSVRTASSGNLHALLRADLAARDLDAEAVRATAILPRDVRQRIEHEMDLEAHDRDHPNKAMEGVLGISSAAFGVHAGRAQEDTRVIAELRCDAEPACDAVSTLVLHARLGWSGNLAYRLLGLGPLIDNLEVRREGTSLFVKTRARAGDLAKMLAKMLDRALESAPTKPSAKPPLSAAEAAFPAKLDGGHDAGGAARSTPRSSGR
jgi:hypothetical protein